MIDWESDSVEICFNSRLPKEESYLEKFPALKRHLIIATSGSSLQKWVALSKEAMLLSAKVVNEILSSTHEDVWIKVLPNHHVGGLGIYARAFLSGAKVVELQGKWDPRQFAETSGTLASLVPTQVYDLVKAELRAHPAMRAIIVGGGALSPSLYEKAKALGWPLLPSYGLTECASQVATASLLHSELKLLRHVEARINEEDRLLIKSDALLSGYIAIDKDQVIWEDPKQDGWLLTEDMAHLENGLLTILGRKDRIIKIAGEQVNLKSLELILEQICFELDIGQEACLLALPDDRLGKSICLVLNKEIVDFSERIKEKFLKRVLPFEQIRTVKCVETIPRTSLGKVNLRELALLCEDDC